MMRITLLVATILLVASLIAGISAFAGNDGEDLHARLHAHLIQLFHGDEEEPRCPLDLMTEHLGLSQSQVDQVVDICDEHLLPLVDQLDAAFDKHFAQLAAIHEVPVNEENLRNACRETAQSMEHLMIRLAHVHASFLQVLTDEQRQRHTTIGEHLHLLPAAVKGHLGEVRHAIHHWMTNHQK